jgi:hypothetical protein
LVEKDALQDIKRLTGALAQKSYKTVYARHRLLVEIGEPVIPLVRDQLLNQSWNDIKYAEQLNVLSGLLSLVDDIDEEQSKKLGLEIVERGCDITVSARIKSILEFTLTGFDRVVIQGVRVYLSKSLAQTARIIRKLE